ncbi:YebC/PmpR family DNA-binding transcriptional regulator [Tropheryma whipplei]|uniref:YebC/PmpR family DNA-binding transcriptional regulator n=1 Tax=Tropheryma whipplei TaxID=2039 RepID=UPI0004B711E0|nr:YebC/PmpR family DNA-binding transcriptional regulator [Tropheryma whipplei]
MSGHSKWATIKRKKAVNDAQRSKNFAKLIRLIEVAAKQGGPDLAGNPGLAEAVQKAKKNSVPNDNIDRAIKRGSGLTGEHINYVSLVYEVKAFDGVALLVECLTDNKNRCAAGIRSIVTRSGCSMVNPGSLAYNFKRKGIVVLQDRDANGNLLSEDLVLSAVLEAEVDDIVPTGDCGFEIIAEPSNLSAVCNALRDSGIQYRSVETVYVPNSTVSLPEQKYDRIIRMIEALEESDDVQDVYTNLSGKDLACE